MVSIKVKEYLNFLNQIERCLLIYQMNKKPNNPLSGLKKPMHQREQGFFDFIKALQHAEIQEGNMPQQLLMWKF